MLSAKAEACTAQVLCSLVEVLVWGLQTERGTLDPPPDAPYHNVHPSVEARMCSRPPHCLWLSSASLILRHRKECFLIGTSEWFIRGLRYWRQALTFNHCLGLIAYVYLAMESLKNTYSYCRRTGQLLSKGLVESRILNLDLLIGFGNLKGHSQLVTPLDMR